MLLICGKAFADLTLQTSRFHFPRRRFSLFPAHLLLCLEFPLGQPTSVKTKQKKKEKEGSNRKGKIQTSMPLGPKIATESDTGLCEPKRQALRSVYLTHYVDPTLPCYTPSCPQSRRFEATTAVLTALQERTIAFIHILLC